VKIRIAVASSNTPADLEGLCDLVDGLEKRRFDTLWLSDTPLTSAIEPLMALAIASARTTRLKLGTNVVVPGRNPLLLAKELAHLDRLTGGRLLLAFMPGIGSPKERAALGVDGVDRNRRLAEIIDLCRAWWSGEAVTAQIAGFDYDGITVGPAPIQDPLEIWLGGNGPKGLELTASHGDGWLAARATPAQAEQSRRTIETLCARHQHPLCANTARRRFAGCGDATSRWGSGGHPADRSRRGTGAVAATHRRGAHQVRAASHESR
jgi:alkanesulfonate monooxygenase SsuD/methylene tetrahydromethanopterin reductase-like flavin-dependent oxidoreductase (luciferase family)